MYDYFRGILERIDANVAIIDVNGIGYRVNCSLPDIGALSMQKGKEVKLFLHLVSTKKCCLTKTVEAQTNNANTKYPIR